MGMQKPNMGSNYTSTYGLCDTAHAQPQNWRDPLGYSRKSRYLI